MGAVREGGTSECFRSTNGQTKNVKSLLGTHPIENNAYPYDRRMFNEVQALKQADYEVSVICPKSEQSDEQLFTESVGGVKVYRRGR